MSFLAPIATPLVGLALVFLLSGWLSARAVSGEAVVARLRGAPPPRVLRWYGAVHRRLAWILLVGGALAGAGLALGAGGREEAGRGAVLAGVAVILYGVQVAWVVGAVRRALRV